MAMPEILEKALPIVSTKAVGGMSPAGSLNMLITAWRDYQTTHEVETTRRAQIAADRDVRLTAIKEHADLVRMMVQGTFQERSYYFDECFARLDQGFASGDDKQIDVALTLIVQQVKVSPMAQMAKLMNDINDPNVKCIEI